MNASLKLVSTLTNNQLARRISQFAANINATCYWQLLDIAMFDTRRAWAEQGSHSCAHWLNWYIGMSPGVAREKLRVAHALADLPEISSAFRRGRLSYSKVRAMTRVANKTNEKFLLRIAKYGSASHIEKLTRQYQRVSRQDSQREFAKRRLDYYWDEQGNLIFQGSLPAESGALFLKALNATVELLDKEQVEEQPDVPAETSEQELRSNQRADAIVRMAESQFSQLQSDSTTADRYQVVIHADVSQELPRYGVENGPALCEDTVKRLCCDGSISQVISSHGEPISIGRKSRSIPPPMRRALLLRDKGCRFPGCHCTRYVDGHHIQHWADGGATSLQNLVLLCRKHHRLVHEGGFSVTRSDSGELAFARPDGSAIAPAGKMPKGKKLKNLSVNPWRWNGDNMDFRLAIDNLLSLQKKFPRKRDGRL